MTQRIYNKIRLLLKAGDADVLPPYKNVVAYRNERRPTLTALEDPYQGVKFDYTEALQKHTTQLLKTIPADRLQHLTEITMNLHDELDRSGNHSIFKQKGATDTSSTIIYMFPTQNILDSESNEV